MKKVFGFAKNFKVVCWCRRQKILRNKIKIVVPALCPPLHSLQKQVKNKTNFRSARRFLFLDYV